MLLLFRAVLKFCSKNRLFTDVLTVMKVMDIINFGEQHFVDNSCSVNTFLIDAYR